MKPAKPPPRQQIPSKFRRHTQTLAPQGFVAAAEPKTAHLGAAGQIVTFDLSYADFDKWKRDQAAKPAKH